MSDALCTCPNEDTRRANCPVHSATARPMRDPLAEEALQRIKRALRTNISHAERTQVDYDLASLAAALEAERERGRDAWAAAERLRRRWDAAHRALIQGTAEDYWQELRRIEAEERAALSLPDGEER